MKLDVLCWGLDQKLDGARGIGYTIHKCGEVGRTQNATDFWATTNGRRGNEKKLDSPSCLSMYYVCGRGKVDEADVALLHLLDGVVSVFMSDAPLGFILLQGTTPEEYTYYFETKRPQIHPVSI